MAEPMVMQWPEYLPYRDAFNAMLDPDLYPEDWLDAQIQSGEFRLFNLDNSAILCSLRLYPSGLKEMHVEAAVGELSRLKGPIIAEAEKWAKEQGCSSVQIQSREGWAKIMASHGYSVFQVAIRKELR